MKNFLQTSSFPTFFDDALDLFKPMFYDQTSDVMKTDIKENDDNYELDIEMPGYDKKDIMIDLEDGYLTISAKKDEKEEKKEDKKFSYIKRERAISCSRGFYVGDIQEDSVKAKYENGILNIVLPKIPEEKPVKRNILVD